MAAPLYQQNPTAQQQANLKAASPAPSSQLKNTSSPTTVAPPAQGNQQPTMQQMFQGTAQFQKPPQQQNLVNPQIPGQPFMGANSQSANAQAQGAAGNVQQGIQVQGIPQPIQQAPQPAKGLSQPIQQALQAQPQTLNQIAPQALLQQPQIQQPQQQPIQQAPQVPQPIQQQQVQPPQLPQQSGGMTSNFAPPPSQQSPPPQPRQVQAMDSSTGQSVTTTTDDPRFQSGQLTQAAPNYQLGQTPQQNIQNALSSNSQQDFASHYQTALQNPQMTGADMLKQNLQQQLGTIDDPNVGNFLDKMASRASQTYQIGMGYNNAESQDFKDAIAGTLTNPQTLVGVQAQAAEKAKDLNLQNIQAQEDWGKAQQAATTDQLQTKRADLEGFLKAQLALSNGSDTGSSTAALTVMSQSLHEADINMTLQNASYTFSQNQLSIQGSKIMTDYTTNIMQLGAQTNQDRMKLTTDYNAQLADIDKQALTDEQTKRQLTSAAYGTYGQRVSDLYNQQQNRGLEYAKFGWQQIKDNKDDAYKMSGLTGQVYTPGSDGRPQLQTDGNGNPIQTFDAQKNQFTQAHDIAALGLQASAQQSTDAQAVVKMAMDQGIMPNTPGAAAVYNTLSTMLGQPMSTMSGFSKWSDVSNYIQQTGSRAQAVQGQIANANSLGSVPQSIKSIFNVGGNGGQCGDFASTISTAPKVGTTYAARLQQVAQAGNIQDNPQAGYKMIVPLGLNTDGQGVGHVETVLSYDPSTRNMLTVDANRDLKGTIGMHIENLDQINSKYKSQGWGFLPGQLQSGIQQKLNAVGQTSFQQITPPQTDWSAVTQAYQNTGGNKATIPPAIMTNFKSGGIQSEFEADPAVSQYKNYVPEFAKLQGVESLMKTDKDRQAVDDALSNIFQGMASGNTPLRSWSSNIFDNNVPLVDKAQGILQQITAGGKQWTDVDRQKYIKMANQVYDSASSIYNTKREDAIQRSVATVPGFTKDMGEQIFTPATVLSPPDQKGGGDTSWAGQIHVPGTGGETNTFKIPSTNTFTPDVSSVLQQAGVKHSGGGSKTWLTKWGI